MHKTPKYNIDTSDTILLVIDPQKAFGEIIEVHDLQNVLINIRLIINAWENSGGKVFLTRHVYQSLAEVGRLSEFIPEIGQILKDDSPFAEFHDGISGDNLITKTRFNALSNTNLEQQLRDEHVKTVVVCGLTTPICVQCTVDSLMQANFQVIVLTDGCGSQSFPNISADQAHQIAIERMNYVFAQIMTTKEFINHLALNLTEKPNLKLASG